MTDLTLTVEREIAAPPERVFDAWLDPKMLTRFMVPSAGMGCPTAKTDARQGGRFHLVMVADGNEMPHDGEYLVVDRPTKLVFSWESPFSVEGSTVTLDFTPTETGTLVRLTHVRFPSEDSRDNHAKGWGHILGVLETVLSEGGEDAA